MRNFIIITFGVVLFLHFEIYAQCPVDAGVSQTITCGDSVQMNVAATEWRSMSAGTNDDIYALSFVSATTGFGSGGAGAFIKTTNGGNTWTYSTIPGGYHSRALHFENASVGYVAADYGRVYKTTNGGTGWIGLGTESLTSANLYAIFFTDINSGFFAGADGYVFRTVNGGTNWTSAFVGGFINALYFVDQSTGFAGSDNGNIGKTTDSGLNWTTTLVSTEAILSLHFINGSIGYAGTHYGKFYKTINGGGSWSLVADNLNTDLNSIYMSDESNGFFAGNDGQIYHTTNGGITWNLQITNVTSDLLSITFASPTIGFASGYDGTLVKYTNNSYSWSPAGSLSNASSGNPVASPTASTQYTVTVTNETGCSATDTVTIHVAPIVISGTTSINKTCGDSAIFNLSANYNGSGNLSYTWSPANGLNDPAILNPVAKPITTTNYTLSVISSEGCISAKSINVVISPFTVSISSSSLACGDSVLLNPATNYHGSGSLNYLWIPTAGLSSATIAQPYAQPITTTTYTATITSSEGCISSGTATITIHAIATPQICIVTVDTTNGKNLVVWEKPASPNIASYNIFKEIGTTGNFQQIGTVPYSEASIFTDTSSNPEVHPDKYKISAVDVCGLESQQSNFHKTIHLTVNAGSGNQYNLIWQEYNSSSEFVVSNYSIYRGTNPGNLLSIGSTPSTGGSMASWVDNTAIPGILYYYYVSTNKPDTCYVNTNKTQIGPYSQSVSNIDDNQIGGIGNLTANKNDLQIYPNPFTSEITITFNNPHHKDYTVVMTDLTGKEALKIYNITSSQIKLERNNLPGGYYLIELRGEINYYGYVVVE